MAAIDPNVKRKLKKLLKELSEMKGRHTELVSVYVPAGYDMNKIIQHLFEEQGTATNIKSKGTRDLVIASLEKMIRHLKLYKQTPPNGLAVFSGNVSEKDGGQDIKVWAIEPPLPLNIRLYRCDKNFILDPLEDMLITKEVYGLVVLDHRDADIALLKGKSIIHLASTHSEVPGKTRAGGQSAQRFARIREGAKKDHFKKVADYMKDQFLNLEGLKGIIVGGPSPTKENFVNSGYITGDLQAKIIGMKDLSYTGEFGLEELVEKSEDLLAEAEVMVEKKLMQRFLDLLGKAPGMVTYGKTDVIEKIKMGAVEVVMVSEAQGDAVIDELERLAEPLGTEVRVLSTETREGAQLRDMGGIVAILRYNLSQ